MMATGAVGKPSRAANLVPSSSLTKNSPVLRVILELDHVIVPVRATHQVRLRAATHAPYLLQSSGHGC
jgi:hypothetical protein